MYFFVSQKETIENINLFFVNTPTSFVELGHSNSFIIDVGRSEFKLNIKEEKTDQDWPQQVCLQLFQTATVASNGIMTTI